MSSRHVFPDCFPDFKPAAKSMESFGTRYTPTYLLEAYPKGVNFRVLSISIVTESVDFSLLTQY